jgi:hypothetical protein
VLLLGTLSRSPRDSPAESRFRRRGPAVQRNFPFAPRVVGSVMLTSAVVFGLVGVVAGFTWDYVIDRGK